MDRKCLYLFEYCILDFTYYPKRAYLIEDSECSYYFAFFSKGIKICLGGWQAGIVNVPISRGCRGCPPEKLLSPPRHQYLSILNFRDSNWFLDPTNVGAKLTVRKFTKTLAFLTEWSDEWQKVSDEGYTLPCQRLMNLREKKYIFLVRRRCKEYFLEVSFHTCLIRNLRKHLFFFPWKQKHN